MDKIAKIMLNWKVLIPLIVLLAIVLWATPTVFRRVRLYQPPADRDLSGWGTIDRETAIRLQSVLDADVNRLNLPGLQGSIQTDAGLTWSGVSGTTDPERRITLSLDEMTTFLDAHDEGTPQITGYGLGLFRLDVDGEEVWASIGFFIGSTTMVAYSPGEKDIVAILGNLSLYDFVSVWENLTKTSRASLE